MKPFLMGTETEYSVSGQNGRNPVTVDFLFRVLSEALREERRWTPDVIGHDAFYLEHGGRFYLDYGGHPEYATPECHTPQQIACYDKAGERLLDLARARVQRERPDLRITLVKNNLDPLFPDSLTFGCHESYTSWVSLEEAAASMVPHLVSRILFAGSGCLSSRAPGGFELSQRARHLVQVTSNETTRDRAIFSMRTRGPRDLGKGWTRAHLIGKDSQRAPFGIYLTFASTGLLFLLLNQERPVGVGLELANPLRALYEISCDPWLRRSVELADGRRFSALDIQEAYQSECERQLPRADLPDWAPEAVRHWGETLAELRRDPLRLADRLDPYTKLLIYGQQLAKTGHTWEDLAQALNGLTLLRSDHEEDVVRAILSENRAGLTEEQLASCMSAEADSGADTPAGLERLRLALKMQALDLHYHELDGPYDWLAVLGKVRPIVLGPEDVERATREAPPGGRAALRSAWIKLHHEPGWVCDWQYLFQEASGTCVDLRDPFGNERRTVQLDPVPPGERRSVLEMLENDVE